MNEIDFKSNKQKTREMLKTRIKKQKKQDRISNVLTTIVILLLFAMFCLYNFKMTERAIKDCTTNGNTKEYCEQVLG